MFSPIKLRRIIQQVLVLTLLFLPISFLFTKLKQGAFRHGNKFFILNLESALLIAAGFALLVAIWNALEFERHQKMDDKQFLLSRQKYTIRLPQTMTIPEVLQVFENRLLDRKRWRLVQSDNNKIELAYRFYLNNWDQFVLTRSKDGWHMESKPYKRVWFIDFSRNYKHIVNITNEIIKQSNHGKS